MGLEMVMEMVMVMEIYLIIHVMTFKQCQTEHCPLITFSDEERWWKWSRRWMKGDEDREMGMMMVEMGRWWRWRWHEGVAMAMVIKTLR